MACAGADHEPTPGRSSSSSSSGLALIGIGLAHWRAEEAWRARGTDEPFPGLNELERVSIGRRVPPAVPIVAGLTTILVMTVWLRAES